MAALEKIFQLLDVTPDLSDRPGAIALGAIRGEVSFEDVSFAYARPPTLKESTARAVLALDHVDLDDPARADRRARRRHRGGQVDDGQAASPASMTRPRGRVLVDGHDLREVSSDSLRSQMGIVPQEAFLFSGTDRREHRLRAPRRRPRSRSARPPPPSAPSEFIAELAHGYDTEVGERGAQLSAGQRQLIAFARALIADPRILVLDEATSNVDLHTEGRIESGPAPAARRAHRDRDRPPPLDDPPGRADRRARTRPHRRAGHPRGADRRRRALLRALPRLGHAGRRVNLRLQRDLEAAAA